MGVAAWSGYPRRSLRGWTRAHRPRAATLRCMSELTAVETARHLADPIGDVGGKWLLAPEVISAAKEHGYANGFVYYALGRGGVLGDVDADVVSAAFGFFNPELVRRMWELGVGVEGPRNSARRYGAACAEYGRARLAGFDGAARFVELAERLVDGAPIVGLSLFAGWRAEPRPDDTPARAYFLAHVLREWRGSAHVAAAATSGLTPLEAILTRQGVDRAKLFGWGDSFDDVAHLAPRRDTCEDLTDRACAFPLEVLFTAAERGELAALTTDLAAAFAATAPAPA